MFDRLRAEARALVKSAFQFAWFMRGSIQYNDILLMTPNERDIMKEFIEKHLENIKDHHFPIY